MLFFLFQLKRIVPSFWLTVLQDFWLKMIITIVTKMNGRQQVIHQTIDQKNVSNIREITITNSSRASDLPFCFPLKPTKPPDLSSKSWNMCLLPIMCCEHPMSRNHDWCFNWTTKNVCNINDLIHMYPLFGSSFVRSPRVFKSSLQVSLWP